MRPSGRFKVISSVGHQGFTHDADNKKHITAMCCHSAGGICVPPLIILHNLTNMPEEIKTNDLSDPFVAWYASSSSGYMNEAIFYYWSFLLVTWMTSYRAIHLPDNIKNENILLIIDGCPSHKCPESLRLLQNHNISVLVIPAHTSHLLQAFDVLLASSLKSYFRKFLIEEKRSFPLVGSTLTKAARTRLLYIRAFIRAWRCSATPTLCRKSFEVVGVSPICPERIFQNPFVIHEERIIEDTLINNKIITSDEIIQRIENNMQREKMPLLLSGWTLNEYENILSWMQIQPKEKGKLLSNPPTLFWHNQHGVWFVLKTFIKDAVPCNPMNIISVLYKIALDSINRGEQTLLQMYQNNENNTEIQQVIIANIIKEKTKSICYEIIKSNIENNNIVVDNINKESIIMETVSAFERFTSFKLQNEIKSSIINQLNYLIEELKSNITILFQQ